MHFEVGEAQVEELSGEAAGSVVLGYPAVPQSSSSGGNCPPHKDPMHSWARVANGL
jgi:hypothetical protein